MLKRIIEFFSKAWAWVKRHPFILLGIVVVGIYFLLARFFLAHNYWVEIFGKGYTASTGEYNPGKIFSDLVQLLILPANIALVAVCADKLARNVEKEKIINNQLEAAFQSYFDSMTSLILDNNLRNSKPDDEVRKISQEKTITTLKRIDVEKKSELIRFLCDDCLVSAENDTEPIITLNGIDLAEVNLRAACLQEARLVGAQLSGADLKWAHLERAHLEGAYLEGVHLEEAHLEGAHLEGSYLDEAHLERAYLEGAHLEGAYLEGAILVGAHLEEARLVGTTYNKDTKWPDNFDPKAAGAIDTK